MRYLVTAIEKNTEKGFTRGFDLLAYRAWFSNNLQIDYNSYGFYCDTIEQLIHTLASIRLLNNYLDSTQPNHGYYLQPEVREEVAPDSPKTWGTQRSGILD